MLSAPDPCPHCGQVYASFKRLWEPVSIEDSKGLKHKRKARTLVPEHVAHNKRARKSRDNHIATCPHKKASAAASSSSAAPGPATARPVRASTAAAGPGVVAVRLSGGVGALLTSVKRQLRLALARLLPRSAQKRLT